MPSKAFEEKNIEKQTVKEFDKEKELLKHEKPEKTEKSEKLEKEHKDQKDNPDTKQQKDGKDQKDAPDTKHKHEKEKQEKEHKSEKEGLHDKVHKDYETQYVQASQPEAITAAGAQKFTDKAVIAEKLPQAETKLHKEIKLEIKEQKFEKFEKFEIKEHKNEIKEIKWEYEGYGGINDPGGPVEQRVAALEAAVTKLLHFIPENLRPDLTQGALKQEPDAPKGPAKADEPKAEPHPKGKS
jgi:hypothetical protein